MAPEERTIVLTNEPDHVADEPSNRSPGRLTAAESVLVLGMHRSGTSAAAGLLCQAGAWPGHPDELMPTTQYNPRGHFERRRTADAIDQLLGETGGSWDSPPLAKLSACGLEPLRPRFENILREVRQSAPPATVPLIKDPRLSLLAPLIPGSVQPRRTSEG